MSKHGDKKRGLILGGTCELALCLAPKLIEKGFWPVLTWRDRGGKDRIDGSLDACRGRYDTIRFDLNDPSSPETLFTDSTTEYDFLIDFAQGDYESLIAAANESSIETFFSENVTARALILKHMARCMLRNRRGRLVYVSSSAAEKPAPGQGFYSAAKLASEALYRNCGLELAGKGITSVILRVGYVQAGRGRVFLAANPEALRQVPLRRALERDEVAETILFLLSPAAAGMNATILTLDGGLTAGKTSTAKH